MTTGTTNALAQASSSYLRSAMHQPIRWHEWGEEAFAKARQENKAILLDIGAVWCHWCHVMDRESYENPEIAQIVNENFIAIKVDRDERPDVDSRYQAAVSAISGQGGWPLTAFLTPDGKPFYGGTYFPPDDHWGRPGFRRVLLAIAGAFREKRGEVMESAESVMTALSHAESFAGRSGEISARVVERIVDSATRMFDPQHGGFGSAPKFPHPAVMDLLIHQYARGREQRLQEVIEKTLTGMALGGVYDQLAGGFHRYSVDERWVVPHFEKMSYDNSELLKNYVHGYQATGNGFYAGVARDILRWMDSTLSDRERGGFYASQDADYSMDDDGDYFTWALEEARAALSEEELQVTALHYDIGEVGEMHHNPAKNVLHARAPVEQIAARLSVTPQQVRAILESAKRKLVQARLARPTPYVDKTLYVSWNALSISAYLEAARVLGLAEARAFGLRSLDRILAEGWNGEAGLSHVLAYSDPAAARRSLPGLLEDYAFTSTACLDAYETTADLSYFHFARNIAEAMVNRFCDQSAGGFFDTPAIPIEAGITLGALAARRKPLQDSPTPAGNPAAAIALLRLYSYTHNAAYKEKAEATLQAFAGVVEQLGIFAGTYGVATVLQSSPPTLVVVIGEGDGAERLYAAAVAPFALNKGVLRLTPNEAIPQNLPPALAETIPALPAIKDGTPVAVVCSGFACRPPVSRPEELKQILAEALA